MAKKDLKAAGAEVTPRNRKLKKKPRTPKVAGATAVTIQPSATEPIATPNGSKPRFEMTVTPITLSFHNLSYWVPIPGHKEPRELLKKVFGSVRPREIVALMDPSGAGKSTLYVLWLLCVVFGWFLCV